MLSMRPGILVLDEPTSQLDPVGTDEVLETVKQMHREGATILMAEHKVEYVAELADRVVVLQEGKIVLQGTPREVLTNPELERYGVQAPYFTTLGRDLAEEGIWRGPAPVTLEEAISGLKEVFR
jgi:energy-coupling factor transporter ATP-binding protein EcfA2